MDTLENLSQEITKIKVEIEVLKKMVDLMLESIGVSRTAEKTADKALAMAQEAVAFMVSQQQVGAASPPVDFFDDFQVETSPPATKRSLPNSSIRSSENKTDLQLSESFNSEDTLTVKGIDDES